MSTKFQLYLIRIVGVPGSGDIGDGGTDREGRDCNRGAINDNMVDIDLSKLVSIVGVRDVRDLDSVNGVGETRGAEDHRRELCALVGVWIGEADSLTVSSIDTDGRQPSIGPHVSPPLECGRRGREDEGEDSVVVAEHSGAPVETRLGWAWTQCEPLGGGRVEDTRSGSGECETGESRRRICQGGEEKREEFGFHDTMLGQWKCSI